MDPQCFRLLEQWFFHAFPGNQKEIFPHLRYSYNLQFRGRSYSDAWSELLGSHGEDRLASIVIEETTARLSEDSLDQIRKLFWADEIPQLPTLEGLDRHNWRAWADTVSGMIDGQWQEWIVQWSPFANLWFQWLDQSPPSKTRPEPPPRAGAYTVGVDEPGPLFRKWMEWKGATVTSMVGRAPADSVVGISRKNLYVLKHWSRASPTTSACSANFVQDLLDSQEDFRQSPAGERKGVFLIACSLTGFTPEAQELAKDNEVELWERDSVVANWLRSGAIGISYESGHWYVVGAGSSKPRAHLTPKRRVRYS